jgi:hypothetical protein
MPAPSSHHYHHYMAERANFNACYYLIICNILFLPFFPNTLFSNTVNLRYSLTESDQVAVVQNTDHYCVLLMREMILLLRFMLQILCPIYVFHCVHKTQNSPTVFDFVFRDCEIIKALRGRHIETHSRSNSHASKGFGFSVPSSKTRSNDLWSREPICQSALCSRINMYSRYISSDNV